MPRSPLHVRIYWLLHRYNPFRAEVGLRPLGKPGPEAPVLVSGNYEPIVEDLEAALAGRDAWLLVADSAGINVWCGAGVGDFNEYKIIDAIIASKLGEKVSHRRLIVSPLAAVGIDRQRLRRDSGFDVIWGPAHLSDLGAYLDAGLKRTPEMKLARFPLRDRLEQAVGILGVFAFSFLLAPFWPRQILWFYTSLIHAIFGTMAGYEYLPPKYPANKTVLLGVLQAALLLILRPARGIPLAQKIGLGLLAHLLVAIDMIGSTPFWKTTIVHWLQTGANESLFQPQLNDRCTSCGACAEVCPKGLFTRGSDRKIGIDLTRGCCECLACVKQCPCSAIDNCGAGWKDDVKSLDRIPERVSTPLP